MPNDAIYEKLKSMIYRGQLNAGERIVERDLARRLGVSRIPLREGIVRLESEGLIRSVPRSSNHVASMGPTDLLEIYSMRLWLEPPAARLVTVDRPANLVRRLMVLCEKMTQAVKEENFAQVDAYDYDFHLSIVKATGHSRLVRAYETAHIRIVSFYTDFLKQKALDQMRTERQHQQIIRAIERGDPDRSEKIARDHVQRSLNYIKKKLAQPDAASAKKA
jgi:DNA-binding GntR family transcriptional regulator